MPEVKHGCILKVVTGDYVAPTKVLVFRMRMSLFTEFYTQKFREKRPLQQQWKGEIKVTKQEGETTARIAGH